MSKWEYGIKKSTYLIVGLFIFIFLAYTYSIIGHIAQYFYGDGDIKCNNLLAHENIKIFSHERIKKIMSDDTQVQLNAVTPFKWDRFYVMQPYTSDFELMHLFGFHPTLLGTTCIYLKDDRNLLVFLKDGELVGYGDVLMSDIQFQYFNSNKSPDYYGINMCIMNKEGYFNVEHCDN